MADEAIQYMKEIKAVDGRGAQATSGHCRRGRPRERLSVTGAMKRVLIFAAVIEAATGVALLIVPSLFGQLRMKKILTEAAVVGDATARAIVLHTRDREAYYYAKSHWQLLFIGGYKFQTAPGVLNLDSANFYFFMANGVTPAMEINSRLRNQPQSTARRSVAGSLVLSNSAQLREP